MSRWRLLAVFLLFSSAKCSYFPEIEINYEGLEGECAERVKSVDITDLQNSWMLKMMDATSKFPSGVMGGNLVDLGSFDECLKIEEETKYGKVLGKFCTKGIVIKPLPNVSIELSACIPDVCDLKTFFVKKDNFTFNDKYCHTKYTNSTWRNRDYCALYVFLVIAMVIGVSTCYDLYMTKVVKEQSNPLLTAFSLNTNLRKLLTIKNDPDQLHFLDGLRAISMLWIVAGHRYATMTFLPMSNLLEVYDWLKKTKSFYVYGAYNAVDTFFFLSGFLLSYYYFKKVHERPLTWRKVPLVYFLRYLRVTPALAALYFLTTTFWKHLFDGPMVYSLDKYMSKYCEKWWWTFFLFVQNYTNYKEMCIIPTWYLSADMQLFIFSPLVILPFGSMVRKKKKFQVVAIATALIVFITLINMVLNYNKQSDNEYETHIRIPIYLIGILMGMIVADLKDKKAKKIKMMTNLSMWATALSSIMFMIIMAQRVRVFPEDLKTNLVNTFGKANWGLALCWIVYACVTGNGGFINTFLSLPIFQIISRLTFSMYLTHLLTLSISMMQRRLPVNLTEFYMFYLVLGDMFFTILFSLVWTLAFESPIITISKHLIKLDGGKKKSHERV